MYLLLLSTWCIGLRTMTGWLGIRIVCPIGKTCQPIDYYFRELALWTSNKHVGLVQSGNHHHLIEGLLFIAMILLTNCHFVAQQQSLTASKIFVIICDLSSFWIFDKRDSRKLSSLMKCFICFITYVLAVSSTMQTRWDCREMWMLWLFFLWYINCT